MKSNFSNTVIYVLENGTPAAALVVKEYDTATANLVVFDPNTGDTTFIERAESGYGDQTGEPGKFYPRPPVVPMGHPVWPEIKETPESPVLKSVVVSYGDRELLPAGELATPPPEGWPMAADPVPTAPPTDNDHVAEGCEQFPEQSSSDADPVTPDPDASSSSSSSSSSSVLTGF